MSDDVLKKLLERQTLWHCRAGQPLLDETRSTEASTVATGYSRLDKYLPKGGWPLQNLIEVLSSDSGIGELRLFMPALASLAAEREGYIVWVDTPYQPYAPALQHWGIDPSRLLLVRPQTIRDVLWATHEVLASKRVLAVFGWLPALDIKDSRRLQLAATRGSALSVLFRPGSARRQTSAASLRLALHAGSKGTEIDFFKIRGMRPQRIFDYENDPHHGLYRDQNQATSARAATLNNSSISVPG